MKKKVFIGLSGGVDSSVAALLLQEEGYDVTAVYMKNWSGESLGIGDDCPWEEDMKYVEDVSNQLGIPFLTYNFEKEYREMVIKDFYEQYGRGNTPNPDILCNKYIKFDHFLKKAIDDGADLIATGHYAKTEKGSLYKAADKSKDQTYFLAGLKKEQLERSLFPIGGLQKSDVRDIARKNDLSSADRKDSQGICFVGKVDIQEFIKLQLKEKNGVIVDIDSGDEIGSHNGVWYFTQGQRRGIGVGGSKEPYFVVKKDVDKNILYVAKGKSNPHLWGSSIEVEKIHSIDINEPIEKLKGLSGMIRYRGEICDVQLRASKNTFTVDFSKPQWAPASGQSVVFYMDDKCVGLAQIS